ncbi:Nucleobase-ascorbate transporter 11-like protein [Drosera capensis]
MQTGSSSVPKKAFTFGGGSRRNPNPELGNEEPNVEPFVPRRNHDPRDLRSWAKRTGFVSGESDAGVGVSVGGGGERLRFDVEKGIEGRGGGGSPKIEIDPVLGRARVNRNFEIEGDDGRLGLRSDNGVGRGRGQARRGEGGAALRYGDEERRGGLGNVGSGNSNGKRILNGNGNGDHIGNGNENGSGNGVEDGVSIVAPAAEEPRKNENEVESEVGIDVFHDPEEPVLGRFPRKYDLKCGITDNLGFIPRIYYSLQHCLSLAGSLVFIPLVIVPAMGGTDKDTANVISSMLIVSGITTLLHSYFGTRLPLVQGSSFVFLAPALVIMNSEELRDLSQHKFTQIMRELQGAIIVGSIFQSILGFSGLMALLLRWINPVVVGPTTVAIGLAFLSYGFPQAGTCLQISMPQIILVLIFSLYLRGLSINGHQVFRIYAVPLSIVIVWAYAFFLTAGGAYNFKGCSTGIPSSNILVEACRKHLFTMQHCRTDVSDAWRTSSWVRIPYPFQWGVPVFKLRTSIIMVFVSLIASVNSIGTYHSASLRANSKPPTPGIVSRGIGMEGFCSILAGLWGTGTGSTTLTENVHTINSTKVANRGAIQLGAVFLVIISVMGKIGGILASIPLPLAASALCFTWAIVVAIGLSTLQYSQQSTFRNTAIVGVSLFLGFSIPAYFQQYQPVSSLILPGYLLPFSAASSGPVHIGSTELDFALNGLLSMNMVVTLFIAFFLDNTVPGGTQETGVYKWSSADDLDSDPASLENYAVPRRVAGVFCWAKCLGIYRQNG